MFLRDERGEGKLGTLVGILVLAMFIYLGVKIVPILINIYEFRDSIEEQARFAALPRHDDEEVKRSILRKAQELQLPVGSKDVVVNRSSSRIDIRVKYTVPIETPIYTYKWSLDESLTAPLF
ncbi:MAG: hypothetical protein DMF52_08355 [Acidobacteria bacterium]|nr:MAG: hypothetical protein AUI52_07420 [Acidobacteria bacterium 13_1_40CM_2_68_10]OLE65842.1 MAG: hypothetical protein AUG03_02720 [Acidobacteria bacterium 13_1_20CM_2_68_14]PYT36160.1 MAG: hypothetical protein DMF52_08355 [Acidobacteriota bacterium]